MSLIQSLIFRGIQSLDNVHTLQDIYKGKVKLIIQIFVCVFLYSFINVKERGGYIVLLMFHFYFYICIQ